MSTAYGLLPPASDMALRTKLRELGIYELPGRGEFVVSILYLNGCSLYPVRAWEYFGNAEYWVDKDGRLILRGHPTQWMVWDLKDTGKTASYPKPILR
jgi:hypothetical protein